ncbi:hypothetical protein Rleg2_1136 [Rhizobium leguminosarum bv. trifolii WSM2304]|uniref:HNH nuclease domain-containing protein n=1 Tax=Rhizobium leguminosarum bv. trifolii (strain WSM2304) TaxID=395492 RepID=A0ABF7QKQ8_RHILW|nr:hypothetical protein Rleg2_1136 [Rhizobium leguminosarum bv. trifolii WSM2304]
MNSSDISRLCSKFTRMGDDECWPWHGELSHNGHPRFWFSGKKVFATHIALLLAGKPRVDDKHALHSCDVPSCVNPNHLRWGTNRDNIHDMFRRNHAFVEKHANRMRELARTLPQNKHVLLPSQTEYMQRLLVAGYSTRDCAGWYGVGVATVRLVRAGRYFSQTRRVRHRTRIVGRATR